MAPPQPQSANVRANSIQMKLASNAPNSGKSLSTVLTIVQLLGMAAVVVWAVLLKRDLTTAENSLAELRARPEAADSSSRETAALRTRVATLESQLATAAAMAMESRAPTDAPAPPPAATPANPIAALTASMNKNPAMRNLVATMQKRMLENSFADLFAMLQFSPEQRSRFVDIMQENQSSQTDAALKMISGNLTAEEKDKLQKEIQSAATSIDEKIREFLGDDAKYATYKQYAEQQGARSEVTALKASLAESGQTPLTPEQASALTNIMYTEQKNFAFTTTRDRDSADPFAAPSAEQMEALLRDQERLNIRVNERAASILSPQQLGDLRRTQAARQEAMKASVEVTRQFFGGAGDGQK
jgi:hypothetical protein